MTGNKLLNGLHLRQFQEMANGAGGVKEHCKGLDGLAASRQEVRWITFEQMWLVGTQPVDLVGPETMHIVIRYQGAFALPDPGQLDLLVPVQVWVEMRQQVFLRDDGLVRRHWYGEGEYFHFMIGALLAVAGYYPGVNRFDTRQG